MNNNSLWVGQFGSEFLVYDPASQVEGSAFVVLWNEATRKAEIYKRKTLRQHVATVSHSPAIEKAISSYSSWLAIPLSRSLLDEHFLD